MHTVKFGKTIRSLEKRNYIGKSTTTLKMNEFWFITYRSSNKSGARDGNIGALSEGTITSLSGSNE
jgi:hypothetical protein